MEIFQQFMFDYWTVAGHPPETQQFDTEASAHLVRWFAY